MTELSYIYDMFLSKIADYKFVSLNKVDLESELLTYFKSARAKFRKCKTDTTLNYDNTAVNGELTDFEIEILVQLMLVEYLKPIILSGEVVRQSLSDKDFKIYSQANQLRELQALYRMFRKEARKMMTEYSYIGMEDGK